MINKPIISDKFYPHGKPQINHTVLFTTHSDPETREGKVLESTTQDYKIQDHKHNKTIWINQTQITSNLGPNYKPTNAPEKDISALNISLHSSSCKSGNPLMFIIFLKFNC